MLAGTGGLVGGCRRQTPDPAPLTGPQLLVRPRAACPAIRSREQLRRAHDAAWLALSSLPPKRRGELAEQLEATAASLEARAHPLLVDVVEADPEAMLRSLSPWLLPVLNAAQALMAGRWCSTDGSLCVDVIGEAEARARADQERHVPAWTSAELAPEARQARFLAWPVAYSRQLELQDAARKRRAVTALRARIVAPDSTLALVLDAPLQRRLGAFESAARLRQACQRCVRTSQRSATSANPTRRAAESLLHGLAKPPSGRAPVDWLRLGDAQILVVPRLSVLARRRAFDAEIERCVG